MPARRPTAFTVFVVDDDSAVRQSLCWLISEMNIPTEAFPSVGHFMDSVAPSRRGCLILDVGSAVMNSLQLQRMLRKRYPHLAMIVLSGHSFRGLGRHILAGGALGYLEKPIDDEMLMALVRKSKATAPPAKKPRKGSGR